MKKLSELTISPAPWSFADDGIGEYDIRCSGMFYGEDYEGDDIIAQSVQKKDAPMLAAAPELYECLSEAVEEKCRTCIVEGNGVCRIKEGHRCHIARWRWVLAKAAGEEVAKCK